MQPQYAKLFYDVYRSHNISATAWVLHAVLVDRMNRNGQTWPGLRSLEKDLRFSRKRLLKALSELEARQLITVERRDNGQTNVYKIPESGSETLPVGIDQTGGETLPGVVAKRYRGGGETTPLAVAKRHHIQIQTKDQTNRPDCGAAPRELFSEVPKRRPRKPSLEPPKPREPDEIWNSICAVFNLDRNPKIPSHKTRLGKLARDYRAIGATPNEIAIRSARVRTLWGDGACTPDSVLKHWDSFAVERANGSENISRISAPPGKYDNLKRVIRSGMSEAEILALVLPATTHTP